MKKSEIVHYDRMVDYDEAWADDRVPAGVYDEAVPAAEATQREGNKANAWLFYCCMTGKRRMMMIYTRFGAEVHALAKTDDPDYVRCIVKHDDGTFATREYLIADLRADAGSGEILQALKTGTEI